MSIHGIGHAPFQRLPTDMRLGASGGIIDCFARIWNVFTSAVRSFLSWIGLIFGCTLFSFHPGPQIQDRLIRQMQYCSHQMQHEPSKPFHFQAAPAAWDQHEERVGSYHIGFSHIQGRRPSMEDEHLATSFALTIAGRQYPVHLFGIFDGHGGREAARFVKNNLQAKLQTVLIQCNPQALSDEGVWSALKRATAELNEEFKNRYGNIANTQGTTATIAMILDQKLWTANVGDSRTVLDHCGEAIQLSEDAKPDDPRYKRGIEKRGGSVVIRDVPRVNGSLAVARAIGDHALRGAINARPKITVKPLREIHPGSHLILSCDGIYDVARTQDIVHTVHTHRNKSAGALAADITHSAFYSGSADNLSSLVVKL